MKILGTTKTILAMYILAGTAVAQSQSADLSATKKATAFSSFFDKVSMDTSLTYEFLPVHDGQNRGESLTMDFNAAYPLTSEVSAKLTLEGTHTFEEEEKPQDLTKLFLTASHKNLGKFSLFAGKPFEKKISLAGSVRYAAPVSIAAREAGTYGSSRVSLTATTALHPRLTAIWLTLADKTFSPHTFDPSGAPITNYMLGTGPIFALSLPKNFGFSATILVLQVKKHKTKASHLFLNEYEGTWDANDKLGFNLGVSNLASQLDSGANPRNIAVVYEKYKTAMYVGSSYKF